MLSRFFIYLLLCLCAASCGDADAPSAVEDSGSQNADAVVVGQDAGPPASDTSAPADTTTGTDTEGVAGDSAPSPSDVPESSDTSTQPPPPVDAGGAEDAGAMTDVTEPEDTASPEDVPPPPLEPTLIQANQTWEVTSDLILDGDYTYAWDPTGQELIVQDGSGAVFFSLPGQVSAPLDVAPGTLHSGAAVADGEGGALLLVAADEGLFVRFDDELVLSPLDALLPSAPHELLASEAPVEGWLWIAMDEGLWVFHDGAVYTVEPEGVETTAAAITSGAPVNGVESLWGVNGSGTWALSPVGDTLNLSATRSELTGTDISADSEGHLWVVDDLGDLHERMPSGVWSWWRLPEEVSRVEAAAELGGLWLIVGDALWFHYGEGYGPLETAIEGDFLGVDLDGRALVSSDGKLWALSVNDLTSTVITDPPTWSADVEPIANESCAPCHGKGAYAHPLFEPEQWSDEIEQILFMVTEPAWEPQMPLAPYPALDNEAVQVIMDWRDAGFPE